MNRCLKEKASSVGVKTFRDNFNVIISLSVAASKKSKYTACSTSIYKFYRKAEVLSPIINKKDF